MSYFSKQSHEERESGRWRKKEITVPGIKPDMLKADNFLKLVLSL